MAKIDRLLAWTSLLNGNQSSFQQKKLCDEIEKRFPVKLVRANSGDPVVLINETNTDILLSHLVILEQEEK